MKYLPLVWAGIWRRSGRAVLMMLQIVSAFTLFGLLQGVSSGVKDFIAHTHRDRLYINSSVAMLDPLPIADHKQIQAIPGVGWVNERIIFGGQYQKPDQVVPVLGTNPEAYFAIVGEVRTSKEAIAALRTCAVTANVGASFSSVSRPVRRSCGRISG